jgi:hypothetical protein
MNEETVAPADPVRHAAGLLWPNLPVLLCGSLLVALAWGVVRTVSGPASWFSVVGLGLVVVPLFAALLNGFEVLLTDEHFGVADLLRRLPRTGVAALRVTALPTLLVLCTLAALTLWRTTQQTWLLASVGLGTAVSLLLLLTGVVALPYVVRTGCRLREGWLVSLYIAARNPVPVLGVLSAVALGVWAAAYVSFALVVLLPAPLAMVWATAVSLATQRSQTRLAARAARLSR